MIPIIRCLKIFSRYINILQCELQLAEPLFDRRYVFNSVSPYRVQCVIFRFSKSHYWIFGLLIFLKNPQIGLSTKIWKILLNESFMAGKSLLSLNFKTVVVLIFCLQIICRTVNSLALSSNRNGQSVKCPSDKDPLFQSGSIVTCGCGFWKFCPNTHYCKLDVKDAPGICCPKEGNFFSITRYKWENYREFFE